MARHRFRSSLLVVFASVFCFVPRSQASELKQETVAAFDRYIRFLEDQMAESMRNGKFLVVDELTPDRRDLIYSQLKQGQLYVEELENLNAGQPVKVPFGLLHHWVGLVFLPGVSMAQALAVLEDYGSEEKFFKPSVVASRVESRDGNECKVYLRLFQKSIVTVVYNARFDVRKSSLDPSRVTTNSYSTKIAEVIHPGRPDEHEMPVGNDHGYLWRLYTYSHIQEKDGGVYIQVESIGLSRPIPKLIAWIVNPIAEQVPRQYLSLILNKTREFVEHRKSQPTASAAH